MQQVNVLRKKVFRALASPKPNEDDFIFPISDAGPLLGRRTADE